MDKPSARFHSTRRPGQPGTLALLRHYGDSLLCVRYYYDAEKRRRFQTVELVVEETAWEPHPARKGMQRLLTNVQW